MMKERKIKIFGVLAFFLVVFFFFILIGFVSAVSQCSDSIDNDCDGKIDMADNGCSSASDNTEDVFVRYAQGCLKYGQKLTSGCGQTTFECEHDNCYLCVLVKEKGAWSTINYKCYGLPACGYIGNGTIDQEPPNITIRNPVNNSIYTEKRIMLDVKVNELSKLERYDSKNERWVKLCDRCLHYAREISFLEGLNELTIRATDRSGNPATQMISFFIDTKVPKISKTLPKKNEFVSSDFTIIYDEDNLKEIKLNYGNSIVGFRSAVLSGCSSGKKQTCSIDVSLNDYDNQDIEYWFEIKDIADNIVESKHVIVKVDETAPVINNLDSFWTQGAGKYNKYIYFNISITEKNFDSVEYIDNNDLKPRWKKLCSILKNGWCVKKLSFKTGEHNLDIQVNDEAGNSVGESISFNVI